MPLPIPYNTGLTEEQIAEVFRRAINDMTDEQITALLAEKVDKQEGFSLMSAADKSKLDDLENYNDTDIKTEIAKTAEQSALNRSTLGYHTKNLLKITGTTKTANGVTFTVNADKTITVSGTATALSNYNIANIPSDLYGKTLILSGCPAGGNYQTGYALYIAKISDQMTVAYDVSSGVKITIPNEPCAARIVVRTGVTVNNLVFKPMLRYPEITDNTYEPYQPSVQEQIDSLTNHVDTEVKADIATVQEQIGNITDQIFGLGTNIPSGADLNNYTQAGVYYAETSTKAGTLLNVPYKQAGFRLEIYYQTNNQRFIQKLFPNTASGVYFHRVYASGGFGSWYKFTGEAVTTT